jgi:hypothetical protein
VTLAGIRDFARATVAGPGVADALPDYFYLMLDLLEPVTDSCTVFVGKCGASMHGLSRPVAITNEHTASCVRIFYEDASAVLPRNFVAVGDSTMKLNPRAS